MLQTSSTKTMGRRAGHPAPPGVTGALSMKILAARAFHFAISGDDADPACPRTSAPDVLTMPTAPAGL